MKLTRSGGLAGISLVASVDLDELPAATAHKVRSALDEVDFAGPSPMNRRGGVPDGFQYDLEVTDESTRSVTAYDPFLDPGLRSLLDVLLPLAEPE